jgi:hypothetical protein
MIAAPLDARVTLCASPSKPAVSRPRANCSGYATIQRDGDAIST